MSITPSDIDHDCPICQGSGIDRSRAQGAEWDLTLPCQRCCDIREARERPFYTTRGYDRVRLFMQKARQATPDRPCVPDEATRLLRAKLIMEEALETIDALGVTVDVDGQFALDVYCGTDPAVTMGNIRFRAEGKPDLVGIVDGCEDIRVVTTGTLVACGVRDGTTSEAVDENNLAKFGPGHSWREDGKLIKPPGHLPPDIEKLLREQGWTP